MGIKVLKFGGSSVADGIQLRKMKSIIDSDADRRYIVASAPGKRFKTKFYEVELDGITGRIARQLYQEADITVDGYERTRFPDNFFDAAVGNVPFGAYRVADPKYDKHGFMIHDYFFAKTLDQVRPGGVVAFVTSKGTLDKANPSVRQYIAQRAELLGAVRLPNKLPEPCRPPARFPDAPERPPLRQRETAPA